MEVKVARLWHGRTPASKADAYLDILNRTGLPDYKATPGNRGAWVLRRVEGEVCHFVTLTFWDSYEAIKAFAGSDISVARYYPQDDEFLLEFEPTVMHYEVYE